MLEREKFIKIVKRYNLDVDIETKRFTGDVDMIYDMLEMIDQKEKEQIEDNEHIIIVKPKDVRK